MKFDSTWLQASAAKQIGTAPFLVITQQVVMISYRRFGTTYRSRLKGPRIQKKSGVGSRNRKKASKKTFFGFMTYKEGTNRLYRIVRKKSPQFVAY